MIIDITSEVFLTFLIIFLLIGFAIYKKKDCDFRAWIIVAFATYLLLLLKITEFPIYIFNDEMLLDIRTAAGEYYKYYQIIPFRSIKNYFNNGAMIQLVGNVILLSPMAVFLEIFTRGRINAFKEVIIVSACSFVIEIIQLIVTIATKYPGHIADVDDLIINILGVIITVFAVKFFEEKKLAYGLVKKIIYKK